MPLPFFQKKATVNTGSTMTPTEPDTSIGSSASIADDTDISTQQKSESGYSEIKQAVDKLKDHLSTYKDFPFRKVRIIQGELWYEYPCEYCSINHNFQTNEQFEKHLHGKLAEYKDSLVQIPDMHSNPWYDYTKTPVDTQWYQQSTTTTTYDNGVDSAQYMINVPLTATADYGYTVGENLMEEIEF